MEKQIKEVKEKPVKVLSVKRLSDDVVFNIGDIVWGLEGKTRYAFMITHMKVKEDLSDVAFYNNGVCFQLLSSAELVSKEDLKQYLNKK